MKHLSKKESDLVPQIKKIVKRAKGQHNAITSDNICSKLIRMQGDTWFGIHQSQVRRIINYIRVNRLVKNLVASNKGYYTESDKQKVAEYAAKLRTRSRLIMEVANSYGYDKVKAKS